MNERAVLAGVVLAVVLGVGFLVAGPPGGDDHPPGAGEEGITSDTLDAHHEQVAALESYAFEYSGGQFVGDEVVPVEYRVEVDPEAKRYLERIEVGNVTVESYYEDGTRYTKATTSDGVSYEHDGTATAPTERIAGFNRTVARFAAADGATFAETTTVDGEEAHVYVHEDATPEFVGVPDAEGVTARVTVDGDGLIRRTTVEYAVTIGGETREVTVETRFTDLGDIQVTEPAWTDDARDARLAATGVPAATVA